LFTTATPTHPHAPPAWRLGPVTHTTRLFLLPHCTHTRLVPYYPPHSSWGVQCSTPGPPPVLVCLGTSPTSSHPTLPHPGHAYCWTLCCARAGSSHLPSSPATFTLDHCACIPAHTIPRYQLPNPVLCLWDLPGSAGTTMPLPTHVVYTALQHTLYPTGSLLWVTVPAVAILHTPFISGYVDNFPACTPAPTCCATHFPHHHHAPPPPTSPAAPPSPADTRRREEEKLFTPASYAWTTTLPTTFHSFPPCQEKALQRAALHAFNTSLWRRLHLFCSLAPGPACPLAHMPALYSTAGHCPPPPHGHSLRRMETAGRTFSCAALFMPASWRHSTGAGSKLPSRHSSWTARYSATIDAPLYLGASSLWAFRHCTCPASLLLHLPL